MNVPCADEQPQSPRSVTDEVIAFLVREARLADEHAYEEWESLWDDEALYWVPRDPDREWRDQISYIADNRARLHSRVAQLCTGHRYSQVPPSRMRRMLSNFETTSTTSDLLSVACNFVLHEYRLGATVWAGRYRYTVIRRPEGLRLREKVVELVNAQGPIPTLGFLI